MQPKLDRFLVVVGQLENLAYFLDYVKEFNIPHIIIPPPIPALTQSKQAQSSQSPDNLYFQKYYGDYIKTSALSNKPAQLSTNEIQLFEFHDIFEEAEYLANFAHQKIANQDIDSEQKDLVIITNNHFLENILASKLRNLGIPYNSSFGDKYSALDEASLIIALTRLKCEEGSIESFLSFISSKLISGHPDVDQFTKLIHAKSRFYENLGAITQDESLTAELPVIKELLGILDHFALSLEARVSKLLELTYRTFKRIYKLLNIQSKFGDAERIRSFMEDIISIDTLDFPIGLPEYFLLVQAMLSLKSVMPFDKSAKIYILNFEDSLLIDAAYVIFADFNQESVIKKDVDDDWIAKKIFSKMLKEERSDNFFKSLYYVNAKAQAATNGRTNLLFTRSIFNDGVLNEQCPILDYINHSKVEFKVSIPYAQDKAPEDVEISLEALPNVLYATNVEMLIRNPYGFYARKILKLTRKQNLLAKMAASDFGSIIHEVIEVISLPPYAEAASPGLQQDISSILEEICRRRGVPSFYVSLWTRSAEYIASEVIALNKEVYNKGGEIFVEVEGVSTVGLSGGVIESVIEPVIELRAIADRIEVYDDKIKIMDFKTGVPPSKSELMSGISPQLIIEAMIYMAGGFKGITYDESRSIELVFLKVNTRAPYIEEKIIKVTKEDVATHKAALIRLLEYYYKNDKASFELEIHELLAPKYDEYSHLRRC